MEIDNLFNDPTLDGKYLGTITKDFVVVAEILKEAAYQIKVRGFSDYPVFALSKTEIPIGQLLIDKKDMGIEWSVYASYLDELVQREIVASDKVENFKNTYKNIDEFCCLFVADQAFTSFVFIPYPSDLDENNL
ncbi:MAG: hypothetical protein OEY51_01175 [Cyclobacteriaceae bacterium]|nr:hypothetical protein [Cyclobacteriaceae bacterium]